MKKSFNFIQNIIKFYPFIILIVIAVIMAGVVLFPSYFYDNFIWKYYWGPVVADASGGTAGTATYNGVTAHAGYTIISELTYGIIIIFAIYAIYKLLKKLKIIVDWKFTLALMPIILFFPLTRVLEDAGYFKEPLVYWFISPLIFFQIAFYALCFLILGYYLEKKVKKPYLKVNTVLFSAGLIILLPAIFLITKWLLGDQWNDTTGVRFDVFFIVVGLIFLIIVLVWLVTNIFSNKKQLLVYRKPLNLAMLAGHMLDGITTYISIIWLGYGEKHPASNVLLNIWGPLFPIVKFILIIVVIYVFDILYRDELKNHLNLVNLLKIGIFIIGFSAGLRDILRVTMGV